MRQIRTRCFVWESYCDSHYLMRIFGMEMFWWRGKYRKQLKPHWGITFIDGLTIHTPLVSFVFLPYEVWSTYYMGR